MLTVSGGQVLLGGENVTNKPFHMVSQLGVLRSFQQTNTFKSASVEENLYRAALFTSKAHGPDLDTESSA